MDEGKENKMIGGIILQILLAAFITERLIEGLHKFYWMKIFKRYLIGDQGEWEGEGITRVEKSVGVVKNAMLRDFIKCKFCQSFWVAWGVAFAAAMIRHDSSLHWIWIGLIAGGIANKIHDGGAALRRIA